MNTYEEYRAEAEKAADKFFKPSSALDGIDRLARVSESLANRPQANPTLTGAKE